MSQESFSAGVVANLTTAEAMKTPDSPKKLEI